MPDNGQQRRLTFDDPVSKEVLSQFQDLTSARIDLAERVVEMEQQKIFALAAIKRVDEQKSRLWEAILMERGIDPKASIQVDSDTGKLFRQAPKEEPSEEQPPPEA